MRVNIILDPNVSPTEVMELGLLAESYDIDALWTSNYPSSRDPFINLCPLAAASSKIRLGALVITPYELHPIKMAKALAGVNEISGGRANILVGGPSGVSGSLGMPGTRMVGNVKECVEILKLADPNKELNYHGDIFQVRRYKPEWATDEAPRIYTAANRKQMLTMASRISDGVMLGDIGFTRFSESMEKLTGALKQHDRPRDDLIVSCLMAWHVKADREASFDEAKRQLALRGMLQEWYYESFLTEDEFKIVVDNLGNFFAAYKAGIGQIEGVPDEIVDKMVDHLTLSGDVSDLDRQIERLRQLGDQGLDEIAFKLHADQEDAIKIIGEHVVPALR